MEGKDNEEPFQLNLSVFVCLKTSVMYFTVNCLRFPARKGTWLETEQHLKICLQVNITQKEQIIKSTWFYLHASMQTPVTVGVTEDWFSANYIVQIEWK